MDSQDFRPKDMRQPDPGDETQVATPAVDRDSICARCRTVPWEELASSGPPTTVGGVPVIEVPESHDQLLSSTCRICRLLATIKPKDVVPDFVSTDRLTPRENAPETCMLTIFSARSVMCEGADGKIDFNVPGDGLVLGMAFNDAGVHNWFLESGFIGLSSPTSHAKFGIRLIDPDIADLAMVRECLSICQSTHGDCPATKDVTIPGLRVIDCTRLVPEVVAAHNGCEYAALSYVWGSAGWNTHASGFPPVVVDAMTATAKMGFKYLWVDRHCIDQDHPEHRTDQISRMGDIYANAQVTIVASSQNPSSYGLPGLGSIPRRPQRGERVGKAILLEGYEHPSNELLRSPWATRGWTLQESLLSPRRVIFSETQVTYLCNTTHWVESWEAPGLDIGPRSNVEFGGLVPVSKHVEIGSFDVRNYIHSVGVMLGYSRRSLTYDADYFNACRGIIQDLERSSIFCPWGIPTMGNRIMLDWYHTRSASHKRLASFPSWSFLGWKGPARSLRAGTWDHDRTRISLGGLQKPAICLPLEGEIPDVETVTSRDWRYLHVTGPFINLHPVHKTFTSQQRLVHTSIDLSHDGVEAKAIISRPRDGLFVTFRMSETVRMLLAMDSEANDSTTSFYGLLLHCKTQLLNGTRYTFLSLLVLVKDQNTYRRVGLLRYSLHDLIRPHSPAHLLPAIAFMNNSGQLLNDLDWPMQVGPGAKFSSEDPLWLEEAETKSIVLG